MAQLKSGSTVGGSGIVTKGDNQALHDTDALRISGSTLYLYKGDGGNESVTLPSSAPSSAQVGTATAGLGTGAVGTYAFLKSTSTGVQNPGSTRAGSGLDYAGALNIDAWRTYEYINNLWTSTSPSGTWRCMGYGSYNLAFPYKSTISAGSSTLWLRIS